MPRKFLGSYFFGSSALQDGPLDGQFLRDLCGSVGVPGAVRGSPGSGGEAWGAWEALGKPGLAPRDLALGSFCVVSCGPLGRQRAVCDSPARLESFDEPGRGLGKAWQGLESLRESCASSGQGLGEAWQCLGKAWARPGRGHVEAWSRPGRGLGEARLPQNQVDVKRNALRVALAGTWLTVYRQLKITRRAFPVQVKLRE